MMQDITVVPSWIRPAIGIVEIVIAHVGCELVPVTAFAHLGTSGTSRNGRNDFPMPIRVTVSKNLVTMKFLYISLNININTYPKKILFTGAAEQSWDPGSAEAPCHTY